MQANHSGGSRERAISSRTITVVVIVMVIVIGLGVAFNGVLNSNASTKASTSISRSDNAATSSTSTSSVTSSSSSGPNHAVETSNSTLGLELFLSVNSTKIPSEDAVNVSTRVLNMRPTTNNLTAANDWPIHGLTSGPCGPEWYPAGVTVFRGNYWMGNLSNGRPLFVWPLITCPADSVLNVTSFSFLPKDDVANYSGYFVSTFPNVTRGESSTRIDLGGTIFAANGTGFYSSLGSALPSTYTLVAGDEWGQIVVLHFEVIPSNNLPKAGNFLSSAGGCSPGPCLGSRLSDAIVFNCADAAAMPSGCSEMYAPD